MARAFFPRPQGWWTHIRPACATLCLQEKFLQERIKVNGKVSNFGNNVAVERQKSKVAVTADIPFSKR